MPCCQRDPFRHLKNLSLSKQPHAAVHSDPQFLLRRSNAVRTSKYKNCASWMVFSLLYQFKRAANIYFLFITVLTFMPFSPKSTWSMAGTFGAVLISSMFKQLYEDHSRKREDKDKNTKSKCYVFRKGNALEEISWKHLRVGDTVQLEQGKEVPADILLLYSEDRDYHVYADTKNLDGEVRLILYKTNSKQYSCIFQKDCGVDDFKQLAQNLHIQNLQFELPNEKLDEWKCTFTSPTGQQSAYKAENLLMRGCMLRKYRCLGLVVYVGHDTKIMKNSKEPPHKISNMISLMNWMLLTIFILQFVLIILLSSLSESWRLSNSNFDYIEGNKYGKSSFFISMLIYWVAYSHMIPISLYVIVEILKIIQKFMIQWDEELIDTETVDQFRLQQYGNVPFDPRKQHDTQVVKNFKDKQRARVRNSDLVEQLGQITHIFSDKTGTLTKNQLKYIKSFSYGQEFILERKPSSSYYLLNIMLNHNVETENGESYVGKSSDEIALLEAARDMWNIKYFKQQNQIDEQGVVFRMKCILFDTDSNNPRKKDFRILHTLEFDSHRKRMSVLCKREQENDYVLYVKGADSSMHFDQPTPELQRKVNEYASEGLRTLVFGHKILKPHEYKEFAAELDRLNADGQNELNADQKLAIKEKLEGGLVFDAVVAIQDKLQDGVQDTLKSLSQAKIRIWVLTGDKLETAMQIGKSCGILEGTHLIVISEEDYTKNCIPRYDRDQATEQKQYIKNKMDSLQGTRAFAIVIDNKMLTHVLTDQTIKVIFFTQAILAKTVLCCRSSPKQKSQVVRTSKQFLKKNITLAIGDGANDVPMIKEAHVGVAIRGNEGLEAHSASDYSITRFRFLERLLLVHGRLAYRRVAWMICYYFYKNLLLVATEIYFSGTAGYSGQIFFADWLPQLYNFLWTSWPCLFSYIFDKDDSHIFHEEKKQQRLKDETMKNARQLYSYGQQKKFFNLLIFWKWIFLAFLHGFCCYWVPIEMLKGPINSSGRVYEHWYVSTVSFSCCVMTVTLKLFIETVYWHWFNMQVQQLFSLIGFFSGVFYLFFLWFGSISFITYLFNPQLVDMFSEIFSNLQSLIIIFVLPLVILSVDISIIVVQYKCCFRKLKRKIVARTLYSALENESFSELIESSSEKKMLQRDESDVSARLRN